MPVKTKPVFARESVLSIEDEIKPLIEKHWGEVAHFRDIPLDPDWTKYRALDSMGFLAVFTAREEGKLIGYSIFLVGHHPHFKTSIQANQDILFISPEKRGFGSHFISWCDQNLKNDGVKVVNIHVNKDHDFGPMLERLGYENVDKIYSRRLI